MGVISDAIKAVSGFTTVTNFNKVIDLTIFAEDYSEWYSINCPAYGRKPSIEITGAFYTDDLVPQFDITIKNLYIGLAGGKAYGIKVNLGYINGKREAFTGNIVYLYQSAPGPESSTVIHCMQGNLDWLKGNINLNLEKGFTLESSITALNKALGYDTVPVISSEIKATASKEPLAINDDVRSVIGELKNRFSVNISVRNNRIAVYPIGKSTGLISHTVQYLSAPPMIQGGDENINYVEITCPYDPDIKPGDEVIFTSSFYRTKLAVSNVGTQTKMAVANVQFHFGTTSNANQMTIVGNVLEGA